MLRQLLSVRVKILGVMGLLTVLIAGTLYTFITSSQEAVEDARMIDAAGEIRTFSTNIELLTREITTTGITNENIILAFQSVIDDDVRLSQSVTRFFLGSESVTREELTAFIPFLNIDFRSSQTEFPEVLAAAYVPVVTRDEREAFEASVQNEGFIDFQIHNETADSSLESAASDEVYFPINYIVPFESNRATSFGLNLGAHPDIRATLDRVRDSGQASLIGAPPMAISRSESEHTAWLVTPIYRGISNESVEERRASLDGFFVLSIDTETLVEVATARLAEGGVILAIEDVTEPAAETSVFSNSRLNLNTASGLLTASFPITVLDRSWVVTLPQRIDVTAAENELAEVTRIMGERIFELGTGSETLGFSGIDRYAGEDIRQAYTDIASRNTTLQRNVSTFLDAETTADREGLLPALQNNTLAIFQTSTQFVNSLVQTLQARVEQSVRVSLTVTVLAAITVAAGLFIVRQIIANLSRVNQTALNLAGGELGTRIQINTTDEIGQIGTSMNQMANQLEELIGTLEQRVADRTRDLEIARKEAENASSIKSQFLAAMSHELRTPLNGILNFTGFVASGMLGPVNDKQEDVLNKAVANGEHLLSLINDVLDISKIESGSLKLFVEDGVNLQDEIAAAIDTGESMLHDKPVELVLDIDPELPTIRADRRRVRQIILNIVSNACKFTDEGTITVSAYRRDTEILVSVKDTGPGIAPDEHDTVFESFRQTETGVRTGKGTGLGMPISRRLAESHGGRLWLESEPGSGATFFVTIPIRSETLEPTLMQAERGQ